MFYGALLPSARHRDDLGVIIACQLKYCFRYGLLVVLLSRQAHLPIKKYLFVAFFGILVGNLVWPV